MVSWYILVGISALLVAMSNILRKHVLKHEHPLEMLAAQAPFRIFFVALLIPFVEIPPISTLALIYVISLVALATMTFRNRSYRHLPISSVAPLQNLSPAILLVFAVVLLGEHPNTTQLFGIGLIMLGGYALDANTKDLFAPLKDMKRQPYSGILFMMLVLLSVMALLDKAMLTNLELAPATYLFWLFLFLGINSILSDWYRYRLSGVKEDLKRGWHWLTLISMCGVGSIFFFYAGISIEGVLIALAVPIRRTATMIETLIGGSLFHEKNILRKAAGCAVMLLGIVFIV